MALDQLADGQLVAGCLIVGERRHAGGRFGKAFAEEDFADPDAAKDRAGARGAGVGGEGRALAEDAAAAELADAVDAAPLGARHIGNLIVGC